MMPWRYKSQNVIVHTKRRSQCCSAHSKIMLKRHNLRGSMSTKVCYYDNACVKSFFHSLNMEEHFISREKMRAAEFDYIKCGYNLRPWQQQFGVAISLRNNLKTSTSLWPVSITPLGKHWSSYRGSIS